MEVILHYPIKPEAQKALSDNVAAIHGQAILKYIDKLSCSKEQKLQLIRSVTKVLIKKQ